jgi:anti-anti-sigma factor
MSEFEVALRKEGDVTYISCRGELGITSASRLEEAAEIAIEGSPDELRLDTEGVSRIGAAGISTILQIGPSCHSSNIDFRLHAGRTVREALDAAGHWWVGVLPDSEIGTWSGKRASQSSRSETGRVQHAFLG